MPHNNLWISLTNFHKIWYVCPYFYTVEAYCFETDTPKQGARKKMWRGQTCEKLAETDVEYNINIKISIKYETVCQPRDDYNRIADTRHPHTHKQTTDTHCLLVLTINLTNQNLNVVFTGWLPLKWTALSLKKMSLNGRR